ncbi:MAG: PAS domain S-box protein, partial [Desulfosarcina sp.]
MTQKPTYDQLVQRLSALEKDVSHRHREVKKLLDSEQTFRNLFENAELLISIYDENGICLLMNRKVASLFGGLPETFIGKSFDDLYPQEAKVYKRRVTDAIRGGQVLRFEDRVQFPDSQRWLLSTIHPIDDGSGNAHLCQILSIDITERKQIEDRLVQFKTAVEHSSDAIGMATPQGQHWFQNEAFDALFGEIGHDPPASLYADETVGREVFETIMAG